MNTELIGLIPAAGTGYRLQWPVAKELWPIEKDGGFYPLIETIMGHMYSAGCNHQVFVVRANKPEIMAHVSTIEQGAIRKSYVCQTENISGPGKSGGLVDAIDSAYHLIRNKTVLFGMPDTFIQAENPFGQILEKMGILYLQNQIIYKDMQHRPDILFGLFETKTPEKFGMVYYDTGKRSFGDEEQEEQQEMLNVLKIFDKPEQTDLEHMWGLLVWSARFTEYLHQIYRSGIVDFATILNSAIERGYTAKAHVIEGSYWDFGVQKDIVKFNHRNDDIYIENR